MSNLFEEINNKTFQIKFKSKINQSNFFKYIEKNFKKWGMVDIKYDKIEKTIYARPPGLSVTFWDKFPVKLNSVGLRNIIISEGDDLNSYLINVNTNELFGNSKTKSFADYFSKEINKKFSKLNLQNNADEPSEYIEKKISNKKKVSAEEKIKNVKKRNPSKIIWWISGIVAFILLISLFGGGGSNNGVYCSLSESKQYNNTVVSCIYNCRKGSKSKTFYYTPVGSPPYCPGYPNSGYKDVDGNFIFKD